MNRLPMVNELSRFAADERLEAFTYGAMLISSSRCHAKRRRDSTSSASTHGNPLPLATVHLGWVKAKLSRSNWTSLKLCGDLPQAPIMIPAKGIFMKTTSWHHLNTTNITIQNPLVWGPNGTCGSGTLSLLSHFLIVADLNPVSA